MSEPTQPPPLRRWANLPDAAEHFGVSVDTLTRWIANGLPVYKPGGGRITRVDLAEVDAYVAAHGRQADQ